MVGRPAPGAGEEGRRPEELLGSVRGLDLPAAPAREGAVDSEGGAEQEIRVAREPDHSIGNDEGHQDRDRADSGSDHVAANARFRVEGLRPIEIERLALPERVPVEEREHSEHGDDSRAVDEKSVRASEGVTGCSAGRRRII